MQRLLPRSILGALVGALLALGGCASAPAPDLDRSKLDAETLAALLLPGISTGRTYFDTIVVFGERADAARLGTLARPVKTFRVLPMARVLLDATEIANVSTWPEVRYVQINRRLELFNREGRQMTRAEEVQAALGLVGEGVEVAVIDTGADGTHPDLVDNLRHNWAVAGFPFDTTGDGLFVSSTPTGTVLDLDVIDAHETLPLGTGVNTDEFGHGTHVIGTIAGTGAASDGAYRGMAPGATIDSYSVSAGIAIVFILEAYDHILAGIDEGATKVRVISNSWGSEGCDFEPLDPIQVAIRMATERGALSVFAYGNSGPADDTCNPYATAPYVLAVAAADKSWRVTDFSSRGVPGKNFERHRARANLTAFLAASPAEQEDWDRAARPLGLFRPSVIAPGADIVSTQSPWHPMTRTGTQYGAASGTSMATPHVSGVAALVVDAYQQAHGAPPSPDRLIDLLEQTANPDAIEGPPHAIGAGFVDAMAAVESAVVAP